MFNVAGFSFHMVFRQDFIIQSDIFFIGGEMRKKIFYIMRGANAQTGYRPDSVVL